MYTTNGMVNIHTVYLTFWHKWHSQSSRILKMGIESLPDPDLETSNMCIHYQGGGTRVKGEKCNPGRGFQLTSPAYSMCCRKKGKEISGTGSTDEVKR